MKIWLFTDANETLFVARVCFDSVYSISGKVKKFSILLLLTLERTRYGIEWSIT